MPTPFDVPPDPFIKKLADYLRENVKELKPPEWVGMVKTGPHAERLPTQLDLWYIRSASLLRKIYMRGPIGISKLSIAYGGRVKGKRRRPEHFRRGGRAIIRKILQQLDAAGLVKASKKGRVITSEGKSMLDSVAAEVKKELEKLIPELTKY